MCCRGFGKREDAVDDGRHTAVAQCASSSSNSRGPERRPDDLADARERDAQAVRGRVPAGVGEADQPPAATKAQASAPPTASPPTLSITTSTERPSRPARIRVERSAGDGQSLEASELRDSRSCSGPDPRASTRSGSRRPPPRLAGHEHRVAGGDRAERTTARHEVSPATGSAAASAHDQPGGRGRTRSAATAILSAYVPWVGTPTSRSRRRRARCPNRVRVDDHSSPTATPCALGPSAVTTPAPSEPSTAGSDAFLAALDPPVAAVQRRGDEVDDDLARARLRVGTLA